MVRSDGRSPETINWSAAGQTIANAAVVPLGAGSIKVKTGNAGAHVIVDVNGYYDNAGLITSILAGTGLKTDTKTRRSTRPEVH